jgi:sugar phosphate permease
MSSEKAHAALWYRWLVFGIMAVAYIFVYFHRQCAAVVAVDLQRDFRASAELVGLMASAYFYPYAILQLPAGLLSDSLGPRVTATVFLLIAVAGSVGLGLAPNAEVAVIARIFVGVGVAMVFIPTIKLASQWFRVTEFARVTAVLNTMGGVGAFLATSPLALFAAWVGWRSSFLAIGAGTLVIAVLIFVFVRNRPQDMGWPSLAEIDHKTAGPAPAPQVISLLQGAVRVVSEPRFWPVAIWFFFTLGIFFSFGSLWAGPYFKHVYGMSQSQVGNLLSMIALGLIIGSPALSLLSDKVLMSRKQVLILTAILLILEMVVIYSFPGKIPLYALYPLVFFFCVSCSAVVVIAFTTTKELFPVEIAGTSVGTVNLFPFFGGAVFQIGLGKVLDWYPRTAEGGYPLEAYSTVLLILIASSVIALASVFFMKETFPVPKGA